MEIDSLNRIGNMALLTRDVNSSNSNGMFDFKRHNIVQKISKGKFVPKHTYNVFSKLLSREMSPDLITWNTEDIKAHTKHIISAIDKIKDTL